MAKMKKIANRVFISDIHLMDGRSMETQPGYNHPYFWTSQNGNGVISTWSKVNWPLIKRENK